MHRIRQDEPAGAPIRVILISQRVPPGDRSSFGTWRDRPAPDTGNEIAEIITDQHDHAVVFRDPVAPYYFLLTPFRSFPGEGRVALVGGQPGLDKIADHHGLLRARVIARGVRYTRTMTILYFFAYFCISLVV